MRENRRWFIAAAVGLLLALSIPTYLLAETPELWGNLKPGPYATGFTTIETYDYSRVFRAKHNYFGELQEGERARQVQVCVWYPAEKSEDAVTMVYSEYNFPSPADGAFSPFVGQLANREVQFLYGLFRGAGAFVQDLLNSEMAAVRDAPHTDGTFPFILYLPGGTHHYSDNAILCEYLASYGYIVAATHHFGDKDIQATTDLNGLANVLRDGEFTFGLMHDFPGVDRDNVGVMGYSFGGLASVLFQMRNSDVDAIVSLDGGITNGNYNDLIRQAPGYNPQLVQASMLLMYVMDESTSMTMVDSMVYASRYYLPIDGYTHADFTQNYFISGWIADTTGPSFEVRQEHYGNICRQALSFFNLSLKGDESAKEALAGASFAAALTPPPSAAEFIGMIRAGQIDTAAAIYEQLRKDNPALTLFNEATFNALGYQLLGAGRAAQSVIVFRMNAETYPNSANVWDSYADGCMGTGDTATAITCYQNLLEALPGDSALGDALRETLRTNAEQGLQNLGAND